MDKAIADTQAGLATVDGALAVKRAKAALQKGAQLLTKQQMFIEIADRLEFGWRVVSEYMADDLADDSDDEKRLEKVEKAAECKAAKWLKKRRTELPARVANISKG